MESLEARAASALRAYELGRARMAARIAILLLPILALCLLEPRGREACVCCGALLLAVAAWLRFRDRSGVESVTTGLLAGAVPLAGALALTKLDPGCATAGALSYCTAFSVLLGGVAGAVVALCEASHRERAGSWAMAATIAALAASLGCARLGIASVAGVAIGILIGRATTLVATRA